MDNFGLNFGVIFGNQFEQVLELVSPDDSPGMADRLSPHEKQKKEEPGGARRSGRNQVS